MWNAVQQTYGLFLVRNVGTTTSPTQDAIDGAIILENQQESPILTHNVDHYLEILEV